MGLFYVNNFISHMTLRRLVKFMCQQPPDSEVIVYINSPGGCTRSALAMFEILRTASDERGITIVTQAVDECYSAALILYLAGDERYATQHASFLIHEVRVDESKRKQAEGYKATAVELEKETKTLYKLICSRCRLTQPMIKRRVQESKDNDWIFQVSEAIKHGVVRRKGFYFAELDDPSQLRTQTTTD